jgi:V8-like Glu-specific endopeptidase
MYFKAFTVSLISASILFSGAALADQFVYKATNPSDILAYWTPERMKSAEAMDLPQIHQHKVTRVPINQLKGTPIAKDAYQPAIEPVPNTQQIFEPTNTPANTITLLDTGTLNDPFTSAQLTPTSAVTSFPYRTAGKLFFTTPSGNKTCSGVLIAQRVVLTAGQCVHNGNNASSGWYSNWMFVPAYNNGTAPYGSWTSTWAASTSAWVGGGGTVPNAQNWGMVEMADQSINNVTTKIGNYVGYLGWQTLSGIPNHATILGYPTAFDNGQLMHQVTAQSAQAVAPNNVELGSDMNMGAGGGPWIQNFGAASSGQVGGSNSARNRIIAVTSYGFNDNTTFGNGASILDSNFTALYDFICAHRSGNCS